MKKQQIDRLSLKVYGAVQWLARNSPGQRRSRREFKGRQALKWWLVYGPTRSGTSYMVQLVKACSRLYVSDWSLGALLEPIPGWIAYKSVPVHDYIAFDTRQYLAGISHNILDHAYAGDGTQLDLAYKQAALRPAEYEAFVQMWGPPERTIFCLREPAGYAASAGKKFEGATLRQLQKAYVDALESYHQIGGDVFDYVPELTLADYVKFLQPLDLTGKRLPEFHYRGGQDHESTTPEMWDAYRRIRALAGG